jgi:hypothetical protein
MNTKSTALYRCFDRDGSLLYVGISVSAAARLIGHKRNSCWFNSLHRVDVQYFSSRKKALEEEAAAIKKEKPKLNKHHNKNIPFRASESFDEYIERISAPEASGARGKVWSSSCKQVYGANLGFSWKEIESAARKLCIPIWRARRFPGNQRYYSFVVAKDMPRIVDYLNRRGVGVGPRTD